jgi:hypothetical protein
MKVSLFIVISIAFACVQAATSAEGSAPDTRKFKTYAAYDIRNCPTQMHYGATVAVRRLEILPGLGFDNLRNLDMGQVHLYNYSTCKVTDDGKFLIPDSIYVIPLREGHFKFNADYFDHWDNYTSITSYGVNMNAGLGISILGIGFNIGGSFSKEKQSVKENQVNYNSKTTRVSFRNKLYAVHLDASAELHPTFKSKIYEIAASVQNNDTGLSEYLAELIIRDYGTHYITSVEAGAVIVKLDYISETYSNFHSSDADKTTVTAAAGFSFPIHQVFLSSSFGAGYSQMASTNNIRGYQSSIKRSEIFTIGGASYTPDLNLTTWLNDVPNRLATIDRTADPIHFAISSTQFPELPPPTVRVVADLILEAANRYYRLNTKSGCVDPKARNFNLQANFGDSTYCDTSISEVDMTFGGLYQTCRQTGRENLCRDRKIEQVNPQTGGYSCPEGYTAVSLYSGRDSYRGAYTSYYRSCHWWHGCSTKSRRVMESSYADYETFWCVVINTPEHYRGYLFGGYFTPSSSNPITGTHSCPPYYCIQKIAMDVKVCVSNDYELGGAHAIRFAGFHSCRIGNPLAVPANVPFPNPSKWPHNCPKGYAQHLVSIERECEINVCLENGAFQSKGLLPPILPPFETKPPYMPYVMEQLAVIGADGSVLVRNTAGQWETFPRDSDMVKQYMEILRNGTASAAAFTESDNINGSNSSFLESDVENSTRIPPAFMLASLALSTAAIALVILFVFGWITCKLHSLRRTCKKKKRDQDIYVNEDQYRLCEQP